MTRTTRSTRTAPAPRTGPRTAVTARLGALGAGVAAPLLLLPWAAAPALAHGAPTDPVSRVYACSPQGGSAKDSAACRAAVAANGGPFTAWDNLRVAGVAGRDRQVVPDGKLCSGGLAAYRGLDLPRRDWPATRLTPGARLTMTYASTIAHTGSFRLYLTRPGYDPAKPLTWADLPARPFAEVKDPALTNGAYHIPATLPKDRTGRQVLYTVWQNTSTPDTYYSCSDVVFPDPAGSGGRAEGTAAKPPATRKPTPTATESAPEKPGSTARPSGRAPASAAAHAEHASPDGAVPGTPVAEVTRAGTGPSAPLLAAGAAAVLVLTGGTALFLRLRRR
ncbi:lytic polysaccharide monooxygenase [Streptomyces sp. J2-1]|uniref:lytic polysaccharide monooxygenase n=1 Tax=Streptomyces corallincola TaxID=2851888 RepID=UPI001C38BF48|nr:lytic polysaccharide monooxygenase [Streptomyces corallincola]MBV2354249.1 lytic polysaccharide monooxygenase [Streptomyces corallincola]